MMSRDGEPEQMIQDVLNRNAKDPAEEEADVMTRAPGHDCTLCRCPVYQPYASFLYDDWLGSLWINICSLWCITP